MTFAETVDVALRAGGVNILGVSIGRRSDKKTWIVDFAGEPTQAERNRASEIIAAFDSVAANKQADDMLEAV